MSADPLEMLRKKHAAEIEKLREDMELAKALPTNGKVVEWTGENGWDEKGVEREPVKKQVSLSPYIFHGPTAYKHSKHVQFKAPDSAPWLNGTGEHVSSKFRREFVRLYEDAVVAAFEPYLEEIVAVKGRYHGHFPDSFEWMDLRDYRDAEVKGAGLCVVRITAGYGEGSFTSYELMMQAYLAAPIGRVQVTLSLDGVGSRLAPVPQQVRRESASGKITFVEKWCSPSLPVGSGVVDVARYRQGDTGMTHVYLFDSPELALEVVRGANEKL